MIHSFFTIDQVQMIGWIAMGCLGFFIPFTIVAFVRWRREEREIRLDRKWSEYEELTGKAEPAANKSRDRRNYRSGETKPRKTAASPQKPATASRSAQPARKPSQAPKTAQKPSGDSVDRFLAGMSGKDVPAPARKPAAKRSEIQWFDEL